MKNGKELQYGNWMYIMAVATLFLWGIPISKILNKNSLPVLTIIQGC
jgi:hypothetical protein